MAAPARHIRRTRLDCNKAHMMGSPGGRPGGGADGGNGGLAKSRRFPKAQIHNGARYAGSELGPGVIYAASWPSRGFRPDGIPDARQWLHYADSCRSVESKIANEIIQPGEGQQGREPPPSRTLGHGRAIGRPARKRLSRFCEAESPPHGVREHGSPRSGCFDTAGIGGRHTHGPRNWASAGWKRSSSISDSHRCVNST